MVILGIDPGFAIVGWGVVEFNFNKYSLIDYGSINTTANNPIEDRLEYVYLGLSKIIRKFKPDVAVVEELFFNNNAKTVIKVGEARGVIILTLKRKNIPFIELTPLEIKMALTGYGRADKRQIQNTVKLLLSLDSIPKPDDAADAIAGAISYTQYSKKNIL